MLAELLEWLLVLTCRWIRVDVVPFLPSAKQLAQRNLQRSCPLVDTKHFDASRKALLIFHMLGSAQGLRNLEPRLVRVGHVHVH
jgi:hypothetical protein